MSASTPERLVYMANQIASFFASQRGDDAALRIADHINAFWDPAMRRTLAEILDAGGEGLSPAALAAARLVKNAAPKAVERALAAEGHRSPGHLPGDDAG